MVTTVAFLAGCLPLIIGAIPTCRDRCKISAGKTAERIAFSWFRVDRGPREELERFIDSMIERKRRGEKIHTSEATLNCQRSLLRGEHARKSLRALN